MDNNVYVLQYDSKDYPEDHHIVKWTVREILEYINADRGPEWIDYDETDWEEGLSEWTDYKVIERPIRPQ